MRAAPIASSRARLARGGPDVSPLPRRSALFGALAAAAAAAAMSSPAFPPPAFAEDAPASLPDADVPAETSPGPPKRVRKNVIITGANSGIGFDGAAKLAALGYNVTLACRTEAKARDAIDRIRDANPGVVLGQLRPAECDLANFASIRRFAAAWRASGEPLDALVLNAGVQYSGDDTVRRTADGLEITVGTNHLGHFLLTNLMLPDLESAVGSTADGSSPRVVVTASEVHDPASPEETWVSARVWAVSRASRRRVPTSRCWTGRRTTRIRRTRIRSCATCSSPGNSSGDWRRADQR